MAGELAAGSTLGVGGHLRVTRTLGRGGMGVVLAAHDEALRREVAVKVMAPEHARKPDLRSRFTREARAVAALSSEHALRIYEVGELDDGTPFLVTELLHGTTLGVLLDRGGPLEVLDVIRWTREALDAIGEAHRLGLVHRDIKPENLFLVSRPGRAPAIKVLDFGLVKDTSPAAAQLTQTGEGFGTPAYMSPEQITGADVDTRSDIWSIGACIYHLLTGDLPFAGDSTAAMLWSVLNRPAPLLRLKRADIPPPLDAIIARCLEKDRALRFADVAELDAALAQAAALVPPAPVVPPKGTGPALRGPSASGDSLAASLAREAMSIALLDTIAASRTTPGVPLHAASEPARPRTPVARAGRAQLVLATVTGAVVATALGAGGFAGWKLYASTAPSASMAPSASASAAPPVVPPPSATGSAQEAEALAGDGGRVDGGVPMPAPVAPTAQDPPRPAPRPQAGLTLHRLEGSGDLADPAPDLRQALAACGSENSCRQGSLVRLHLFSDKAPRALLSSHEGEPLCIPANNCVMMKAIAYRWRPICHSGISSCDRAVDIVF